MEDSIFLQLTNPESLAENNDDVGACWEIRKGLHDFQEARSFMSPRRWSGAGSEKSWRDRAEAGGTGDLFLEATCHECMAAVATWWLKYCEMVWER